MYFQKMVEKLGHKNENFVTMMTKFPSIRPSFQILETWSFSEVPLLSEKVFKIHKVGTVTPNGVIPPPRETDTMESWKIENGLLDVMTTKSFPGSKRDTCPELRMKTSFEPIEENIIYYKNISVRSSDFPINQRISSSSQVSQQ